jgi:hypothetical protein
MAIAAAGFGSFGGDLLVGNFSFADSEINAFDATIVKCEGTIHVNPGAGNMPGGLWDPTFGGGAPDSDPMTLYLTDGVDGRDARAVRSDSGLALFAARRRTAPAIG